MHWDGGEVTDYFTLSITFCHVWILVMLVVSLLSTHSFSDYLLFAFNQMSEKEGKPFAHCIHRQEMTRLLNIQALEMSALFIIKRNYYVAMIVIQNVAVQD